MRQRFIICKESQIPQHLQYFNYRMWKPPAFGILINLTCVYDTEGQLGLKKGLCRKKVGDA